MGDLIETEVFMRTKTKTVEIKRAREAKAWRSYYFGAYLPAMESAAETGAQQELKRMKVGNFI